MTAEFGGDAAVRDHGLLESAVMMPAARFGGSWLHPDLASMAAAYLFHLCKNHPFMDGNKRTALAAAEIFLILNARRLVVSDDAVYDLTMGVASGTITKDQVVTFFRRYVKKEGPSRS